MTQIVFNEVPTIELKDDSWSIFVKKEKENQIKTGSTFSMSPDFENDKYVKIADFDSFLSLNGKHESQVVQNAIEKGQFRSVNKIRKPDSCIIELAKGGKAQDIQLVLDNLKKYKDRTDLLTVSTPFGTMEDMNLIALDYSFTQGATAYMLIAKLTLQQIQSGDLGLEYTTAMVKDPQNTDNQDVGEKVKKEA